MPGSWHKHVACTTHPKFNFDHHKLVWAINQAQITNSAVAVTAVMKSEVITGPTQSANFWIAPHHHIKRGPDPSDTTPEI